MAQKKKSPKRIILPLTDIITSVIVVAQNDEDIIQERILEIHEELKKIKVNFEILVIDNNSLDNTVEKVRDLSKKIPFIRVIVLSRTYTYDVAFTAGLDSCIGDYAIIFSLYTDPAKVIPVLLQELLTKDVVIGKTKTPITHYSILSRLLLSFVTKLSRHEFTYRTNFLAGFNRKAINAITRTRRRSRNVSYLNYLIGLKKHELIYLPIKSYKQKIKNENFFQIFFTVTDIIISNSFRPIRLLTFLGILASVLFILYVILITCIEIIFHKSLAPQGWISISAVMGSMFLLLFSLLALISEYLIRTLDESRDEPLYFVADEIDKSMILAKEDALNIVS